MECGKSMTWLVALYRMSSVISGMVVRLWKDNVLFYGMASVVLVSVKMDVSWIPAGK